MLLLAYVIFKSNMIANICFLIWQARIRLLRQQEVEVVGDVWLRMRVCSHAVSPHRIGFGVVRGHSKLDRCPEVNMNKSTSPSHTHVHMWACMHICEWALSRVRRMCVCVCACVCVCLSLHRFLRRFLNNPSRSALYYYSYSYYYDH